MNELNTEVCSTKLVLHDRMNDLLPFSNSSSCVSIDIYHKLTLSCEQARTLAQNYLSFCGVVLEKTKIKMHRKNKDCLALMAFRIRQDLNNHILSLQLRSSCARRRSKLTKEIQHLLIVSFVTFDYLLPLASLH